MVSANDSLESCTFLATKELVAFASFGYRECAALLAHYPKRYENRRRFDKFPNEELDKPVCLRGTVIDAAHKFFGSSRRLYEVVIMDGSGGLFGSGRITCRWFNMPFVQKIITTGHEVIFYGMVKELKGRLIMDHPEFEMMCDDRESIHMNRIVPIYKNIPGISQRRLREIIHLILIEMNPESLEIPYNLNCVFSRVEAVGTIHFPESLEVATLTRRRFALEEIFQLQLNVAWRRRRNRQILGRVMGRNTMYLKQFYTSLPFDLTAAQKRSIKEILADLRVARPMNRLLQGDVGSGKTFVAMAAILLAIGSGCQAALMAPTQILAEQHYLTFRRWLEPLGVRVALRTGIKDEKNYSETNEIPQVIIGTHALLYDSSSFVDLGFIVIDEQHKFGVAQRAALIRQGVSPHVLVMTATPIPRTLTMTVYGDLDVSLLDEKPCGRGKTITAMRITPKQSDVTKFIKEQLGKGRQAYLVYPLIEECENLKAESAIQAFEKWKKRLGKFEIGLIHGKLRPDEKQAIMARFQSGKIHVLVATTVIEVGVDVSNASVMVVHHAERFGLAQLHQLRGRIGRGEYKSYCILLTDAKNTESLDKLKILVNSADGFEIAEADLRLRGPGALLGTMQSGLSDFRFPDFLSDIALLQEGKLLVEQIFKEDPTLEGVHRDLRRFIQSPDDKIH